ncbi:MAG: M48 family metalloprotease, partial [Kiritimatiellaeota bacterium]|nr:M48 family metalloprotease [Kiritimatiellota bacterium]
MNFNVLRFLSPVSCLLLLALLTPSCVPNPVTGSRQLQLYTEQEDLTFDTELTPLLIAAGYGSFNDPVLADYVAAVGQRLVSHTHRPNLSYRFLLVNAPAPSATALPGGTLIISRGLVAQLQNEAQLAALIAHNLAHINARDLNPRTPARPGPADSSSLWDGLTAATG